MSPFIKFTETNPATGKVKQVHFINTDHIKHATYIPDNETVQIFMPEKSEAAHTIVGPEAKEAIEILRNL